MFPMFIADLIETSSQQDITAGLMWLVEAGFTTYRHYERYYGLRYR